MTTTITPKMLLDTLTQWGIPHKPYVPAGGGPNDWLTHNRNAGRLNSQATPGGWGPLRGTIDHNTAMTATQAAQLAYLWRGDGPTSDKPGPLCNFALGKDGMVWLMAWGAATHAGPGTIACELALREDRAPFDRELVPTTTINDQLGTETTMINPFYFGTEQMHAAEGPTAIQRVTNLRLQAALLWLLGGPSKGYSAASAGAHRELTTTRSDPQGIARDGALRRGIRDVLAKGPAAELVVPAPAKLATKTTVTVFPQPSLIGSSVQVRATTTGTTAGTLTFEYLSENAWQPFPGGPRFTTGNASFDWRFGGRHPIRARFTPTDSTKYAGNASDPVMVEGYQLSAVLERIDKLEAGTTTPVPVPVSAAAARALLAEPPAAEPSMEELLIAAEWDLLHPSGGCCSDVELVGL